MFKPEPTIGLTALLGIKLLLFLSEEAPAFFATAGSAAVGSFGIGAAAAAIGGGAAGAGGPVSAGAGGGERLHIFFSLAIFLFFNGFLQAINNFLLSNLPIISS